MLTITIPAQEVYDEASETFISLKETTVNLEHSLISLSKWESKYCKPFLTKNEKTKEEIVDYIRFMCLSSVDPLVFNFLTTENFKEITDYIEAPMTATTFGKEPEGSKKNKEIVTSELIYYWMVASQIPFECQKWHLNRLMTLIRICGIKNAPPKKMSKRNIMSKNAAMNAARKASMGTNG